MYLFVAYLVWMLALSSLTFIFWIRPEGFFSKWRPFKQFRSRDFDLYTFIASSLGILFFISCFVLGIWISTYRLKGHL